MNDNRKTISQGQGAASALSLAKLGGLEKSAEIWVATIGANARCKVFLTPEEVVEWVDGSARSIMCDPELARRVVTRNPDGTHAIDYTTHKFNLAGYVTKGTAWKKSRNAIEGVILALTEGGVPRRISYGLLTLAGFGALNLVLMFVRMLFGPALLF